MDWLRTERAGAEAPAIQPKVVALAGVEPERVAWLLPGRLAVGKLTVLDGDPGLGKSTITLDWAARISRGDVLPGDNERVGVGVGNPRGVLLLSAEDGLADTLRPRLDAAGANLNRVYAMQMADTRGNTFMPNLAENVDAIERMAEATDAALIVIDPLMAFLGGTVNSNRDQDVRQVLSPVASMAERTGCSILILRHLNKAQGMSTLYRGGGSIGIIGAARFGLLVGKDPNDETGQRRVLSVQKCNIGPEATSLAYRLSSVEGTDVATVEWLGESHVAAYQLAGNDGGEDGPALQEARDLLLDLLTAGPMSAKEVEDQAKAARISLRTIQRAKSQLGIKSRKSGYDGGWQWVLPERKGISISFSRVEKDPFVEED